MGVLVPQPPVRHEDYLAGLDEGRDLYREDLDRMERRSRLVRRVTTGLVLFAMVTLWVIVWMLGK